MRGVIMYSPSEIKLTSLEASAQLQRSLPHGMACIVIVMDSQGKFHWACDKRKISEDLAMRIMKNAGTLPPRPE